MAYMELLCDYDFFSNRTFTKFYDLSWRFPILNRQTTQYELWPNVPTIKEETMQTMVFVGFIRTSRSLFEKVYASLE